MTVIKKEFIVTTIFFKKKKKILNFPLLIFIDISLSTSFCTVQILSCKTKGPCSVQNLKFVEHLDKSQPCYLLDDDYRDISQSPETSSLVSIRRIFLFKHRYRSEASWHLTFWISSTTMAETKYLLRDQIDPPAAVTVRASAISRVRPFQTGGS